MSNKYVPPHARGGSTGMNSSFVPHQQLQSQSQSQPQSQPQPQPQPLPNNMNNMNNMNNNMNGNQRPSNNQYSSQPQQTTNNNNYDLGFANTNTSYNGYRGGGGGGDRFRRFGNNSNNNNYGNGNGNGNGNGGNRYGKRFTRPQYNNNSNRNSSGGGGYSTYTDRYSSSSASTERNAVLERELFGDDTNNTIAQGINFKNYDKIPVEVSGREAPQACDDFSKSNLCQALMDNIALCKYTTPTPIQKYAIPCVIQNRDIMACAQTGSGKTAAFLLPIIHNIYTQQSQTKKVQSYGSGREVYPSAVVLSPTRELAIQIHVQCRKFLYRTGLRTCVVYGGADWRKQARDLRHGVDIIVATPGRLNDFMERGFVSMSAVQYNVLDEADRMLDMGFMPQIKQIIREMPPKTQNRQTLMFSATFPLEIQKLAQDFLADYIFIAVGRVGSTNQFIDQKLKFVQEYEKTGKLIEMIGQIQHSHSGGGPILTLIFVEKKRDAARVEKELIRSGYDAMSIHGDRSQKEREHALKMFRMGKVSLLVATDVASRGLDIPNVLYVINYDLPNNVDSYVHRIGRTGRCGNNGNAISFVNETNKPVIKTLMTLLKESKSEIPQWFADLHSKFSSYQWSSQNKYGSRNKYGGNSSYNSNKKFGARDFRHGRSGGGGGGGGYKRNTYNHYNHSNSGNNQKGGSASKNEQQWSSNTNQNQNVTDSW